MMGETRLVALLGHPVAHSLSPRMQNAAFTARSLDWAYVAFDVPPERLNEAVRGLAAQGFVGANVTAPHKEAAAALCDETFELAATAGSVNTLRFEDGRVHGWSTDAEILRGLPSERPAIVGAGGAASAFAAALPEARRFSRRGEWPPHVADADLVVHATPLVDELPFEPREGQTVVDLAYRPDGRPTALVEAARALGCRVLDGLDVLVAQGAASFERWTGVAAPVDVMRAAVRSGAPSGDEPITSGGR